MAQTTYRNSSNLGMLMALWLAMDDYDHDPEGAPDDDLPIISATQLLKPTKALILGHRVPEQDREIELVDMAAARLGQAVHTAIENAVLSPRRTGVLKSLGAVDRIVDNIVVNPTDEFIAANPKAIAVYMEKRAFRKIKATNGQEVWISGKYDFVFAGRPEDNKSTSTYKYTKMDQSELGDYGLQMGIYKWLNPKIITSDLGQINFIFKDWKRGEAQRIKGYPEHPVMEMPVQLMDPADCERFIRAKIDDILKNAQFASEADMTRCTQEELWQSPDVHKYYADPAKAKTGGRATKNFDDLAAAMAHKNAKGKGVVITKPGEVRRCSYCDAAPLCTQRLEYVSE